MRPPATRSIRDSQADLWAHPCSSIFGSLTPLATTWLPRPADSHPVRMAEAPRLYAFVLSSSSRTCAGGVRAPPLLQGFVPMAESAKARAHAVSASHSGYTSHMTNDLLGQTKITWNSGSSRDSSLFFLILSMKSFSS